MPCQCGCCAPAEETDQSREALESAKQDAERRAEAAEKELAALQSERS